MYSLVTYVYVYNKQGFDEPEEFWYWASTDGTGNDDVDDEDYEVSEFYYNFNSYCCVLLSLRIHWLPSTSICVPPITTASGVG